MGLSVSFANFQLYPLGVDDQPPAAWLCLGLTEIFPLLFQSSGELSLLLILPMTTKRAPLFFAS